jgi:hypothetical protein
VFLTSDGVYRLLFNSKKPKAKNFRKWACAILNDINFNDSNELGKAIEVKPKPDIIKQSEVYNETFIYVRIRLPEEYLSKTSKEKDLSLNVIKPGIAYYLRQRNNGYNEEASDNGYFIYSFSLNSRQEAELIEKIYKFNFKDITVFGSTEYFDTEKLAKLLKFNEFVPHCYKSYLELAKVLFDYIVNLVKSNFIGYNNLGYIYNIQKKYEDLSSTLDDNVGITTSRTEITNLTAIVDKVEIDDETDEVITRIVGRDLQTGEEVMFNTITDVCLYYKCNRIAFTKTYLDKPFQFHGKHWRKRGNKKWLGIKNLVYDPAEAYNFYEAGYIKATNTLDHSFKIYEGYQAAHKYTTIHPYTIRRYVRNRTPYRNTIWSILLYSEFGKWIDDTMDEIEEVIKIEKKTESVKQAANHYGKIVALDLKTNVETIYNSIKQFSTFIDVSQITLRSTFIDKQRQVKGFHVRFAKNGKKWFPPDNLIYDSSTFQRGKSRYIMSTNEFNNDTRIYESQTSACKILNYKEHSLKYALKTGITYDYCYWKFVDDEDVGKLENCSMYDDTI